MCEGFPNKTHQNNIFYSQDSRNDLAYLVWLIVELDKEDDTVIIDGTSKRVQFHTRFVKQKHIINNNPTITTAHKSHHNTHKIKVDIFQTD